MWLAVSGCVRCTYVWCNCVLLITINDIHMGVSSCFFVQFKIDSHARYTFTIIICILYRLFQLNLEPIYVDSKKEMKMKEIGSEQHSILMSFNQHSLFNVNWNNRYFLQKIIISNIIEVMVFFVQLSGFF